MAQYLQAFIEVLEKHHPDELLRIKREIDPVYEATAILRRPERERRLPMVILVLHSDREADQKFGVWEDAHGCTKRGSRRRPDPFTRSGGK